MAARYEDGFRYALEQVRISFPDLDAEPLGEADALNQIVDGRLVPFIFLQGSDSLSCRHRL
ncbi:hypothetical protein A2U01_0103468, partial [Trifolium medium]|nr:hypothetical protein [Trifolium medium]